MAGSGMVRVFGSENEFAEFLDRAGIGYEPYAGDPEDQGEIELTYWWDDQGDEGFRAYVLPERMGVVFEVSRKDNQVDFQRVYDAL